MRYYNLFILLLFEENDDFRLFFPKNVLPLLRPIRVQARNGIGFVCRSDKLHSAKPKQPERGGNYNVGRKRLKALSAVVVRKHECVLVGH